MAKAKKKSKAQKATEKAVREAHRDYTRASKKLVKAHKSLRSTCKQCLHVLRKDLVSMGWGKITK